MGVIKWAKENGYTFPQEYINKLSNNGKGSIRHVDIMLWCNALSEINGLEPVYRDVYTHKVLKGDEDCVKIARQTGTWENLAFLDRHIILEEIGANGFFIIGFEKTNSLLSGLDVQSYYRTVHYVDKNEYEWYFYIARNGD